MYNSFGNQGYGANPNYSAYGAGPAANQGYQYGQPTGMPQQPGLFQGLQTGLQGQPTGFQGQQQFQNPLAFGQNALGFGQNAPAFQQNFQQLFQPQQPIIQPQQTGYMPPANFGSFQAPADQTGAAPLTQQKTGFSTALAGVLQNTDLKIPAMRLSFISLADQVKFEGLFRTAVGPGEQSVSGEAARDILLRSGLLPVTLAEIWSLADTNKLGLLLFPEFALALHLCNSALRGEPLPGVLPPKWLNEVQSFVDAISFAVPENASNILANTPFAGFSQPQETQEVKPPLANDNMVPLLPQRTSGFLAMPQQNTALKPQGTGYASLPPTSFQPQATGFQNQQQQPLQAQGTGFNGSALRPQPQTQAPAQTQQLQPQGTGYNPPPALQAQNTGYLAMQPQATGFQPQATTFQPQATGFQPQATGFQPQATGFQPQATGFQPQATGFQASLQAQPTGKPGQWGFVSAPTSGLPGLNAMQQHFLPTSQLSSNNLQNVMGGALKENVTWAITKQEKAIYDGVFAAWDKARNGYIQGDVAIGIFNKSGLSRPDLESIWNLCDTSNRGKLNKDEFAVAMHLVYRRLNGYDIPLRLPPELIPPSTKYLQDSVDSLKLSLKSGKKAQTQNKTSASRYKNNDDDVAYVSGSRHRSRNPPEEVASSVRLSRSRDLTLDELRKLIREKQILIDAVDLEDQHNAMSRRRDANEIELLKTQITEAHAQLMAAGGVASESERASLLEELNRHTRDTVPLLISKILGVTNEIANVKRALAKQQLKKEYPSWDPEAEAIEPTGPNGEITEADRRKFKSKQLLRQRMAALTGKEAPAGNPEADKKWQEMSSTVSKTREDQTKQIRDIEASVRELEDGASVYLQSSVKNESGYRKCFLGEGVLGDVKLFIDSLASMRPQLQKQQAARQPTRPTLSQPATPSSTPQPSQGTAPKETKPAYQTASERVAYVKAQAEKRMTERLAKLGITRRADTKQPEKQPEPQPEPAPQQPAPQQPISQTSSPVPPQQVPQQVPQVAPPQKPESQPKPVEEQQQPDDSDSSDDEEYAALMRQKKEMEARKLAKKKEKEERLARLKKEMASMKDDDWSDDEPSTVPLYKPQDTAKAAATASSDHIEAPTPVKAPEVAAVPEPSQAATTQPQQAPSEPVPQAPSAAPATQEAHKSNPFARPGNNTNPFFKSNPAQPVNQQKLEAQRASQRGLDTDDWSDDEQKSSHDEGPNRAGAAKLASLLFGGMPQPVARASTDTSQSSQAATATESAVQPVAPVPVQAVAPPAVPESVPAFAPPPVPEAQPSVEAPQVPAAVPEPVEPAYQNSESSDMFTQEPQQAQYDSDDGFSDSTDEFATPLPEMRADEGEEVPPISLMAPPVPNVAPPVPEMAPPVPEMAPPVPQVAPPVPSMAPPFPTEAPPAPVFENGQAPTMVPPPPPPPPAGIPPPPSGVPPPPFGGAPPPPGPPPSLPTGGGMSALLGQIQGGKALKKVDDSEKRIAELSVVGRVL